MATAELLLTIEDFIKLPSNGRLCELVEGRVVEMNSPTSRHGKICTIVCRRIGVFVEDHRLGETLTCDAGVITRRNPDSMRGPDVSFYSFQRLTPQAQLSAYWQVAPDLVCEVKSDHDRWSEVNAKALEYLDVGVRAVCVFDPDDETVTIFRQDRKPEVLAADGTLTIPDVLPGFSYPVAEFFA